MEPRANQAVLSCLIAAVLFGASTPVLKLLLGSTDLVSLAGLLYLGAAISIGPFAIRPGLRNVRLGSGDLARLAGVVIFGGALGPVLLLLGLSRTSAASASLWLSLETVATGLLAWALFREHLSGRAWLAMAMVCLSSVLIAGPARFEAGRPAALIAAACICWGIDNNLTALIHGLTPAQTSMAKGLVAGGINLWRGGGPPTGRIVVLALVVGSLAYGFSLILHTSAARQLGAARAQMIFSTASFWGLLLSWTLLSEPILWAQIVAGVVMLAAFWLLYTERHAHEHAHEAITHRHWHRHDDGHHEHVHPGLPSRTGHSHEHAHASTTHTHLHHPDLQHRHEH
jgi:drug/metabolite transporter (DMT)-like permease